MAANHFYVAARELILDVPQACPFYPPLAFVGLAITPDGEHHLILTTGASRFYAGPDTATVRRRSQILSAALRGGRPQLDPSLVAGAAAWIELCWESVIDELVDAIAVPALEF